MLVFIPIKFNDKSHYGKRRRQIGNKTYLRPSWTGIFQKKSSKWDRQTFPVNSALVYICS